MANFIPPANGASQVNYFMVTDGQTNSLRPYTGVCGFFLSVKFAISPLALLAGELGKTNVDYSVAKQ